MPNNKYKSDIYDYSKILKLIKQGNTIGQVCKILNLDRNILRYHLTKEQKLNLRGESIATKKEGCHGNIRINIHTLFYEDE